MTELEGREVPRFETQTETIKLKGKVPVDVGNTYAQAHPGEPATGDWLIIRFESEPKTLNPMTESSAVSVVRTAV